MGIGFPIIVVKVEVTDGNRKEPFKTVVLVCMPHIERKPDITDEGQFTGSLEQEIFPVPHILDIKRNAVLIGKAFEFVNRFPALVLGFFPFFHPCEIAGVDNNTGIYFGCNRKTLPRHLNACPPDRFQQACNIGAPARGVDREFPGITLEGSGVLKIMKPFVHNLDKIRNGSDPLKCRGKRLVMEAEG